MIIATFHLMLILDLRRNQNPWQKIPRIENSKLQKIQNSDRQITSKKYKNGSIFKCFIGTELKPSYFLPRNKFLTGILNFMQLKMHKNPGSTLKIRLHCNPYSHLGTLNRNMS